MTVLSAQSIRARNIFIPFHERTRCEHSGMTFGLSSAGYDVRIAESLILKPGEFSLASTVEEFHMSNDTIGIVHDKSTLARRGLALQNTVIEPSWIGYLTLELSNHGEETLEFISGMPIAQIIFHLLDQPTEQPYSGRYQNQEAGPQAARFLSSGDKNV